MNSKKGSIDKKDKKDEARLDRFLVGGLWSLMLGFLLVLLSIELWFYVILLPWIIVGIKLRDWYAE